MSKKALKALKKAGELPSVSAVATATAPVICAVLREFGDADIELAQCCLKRAVELCGEDASQRGALLDAGLATAAVGAMQAHLLTRRVQLAGCAALGAVAMAPAAGAREAVAETAGGGAAVVAAMRAHDEVADVQEKCCAALGTLEVSLSAGEALRALRDAAASADAAVSDLSGAQLAWVVKRSEIDRSDPSEGEPETDEERQPPWARGYRPRLPGACASPSSCSDCDQLRACR